MLAWRPVLLSLCATPSHYPHSALRIVLGMNIAQGFNANTLLHLFGEPVSHARAAIRSWLAKRPSELEARQWELTRGLAMATGGGGSSESTREVRGTTAAAFVAAGGPHGIAGALMLLEVWVVVKLGARGALDLQRAADAVGARCRALVACLAVDHGVCSAASVARHFDRAKSTLSEQMTACRARPADEQILRTPAQRIIEEALALPPIAP